MAVMTESDTAPTPGYAMSDGPRRLVLADLVARLAAGVASRARVYEMAVSQAEGALRDALEALARGKHAQAADLLPLAQALGASAPILPPALPSRAPWSWGVALGEAFQAERALEEIARELTGLTTDPVVRALATRLTARVGKDREEVRRLYLRYC